MFLFNWGVINLVTQSFFFFRFIITCGFESNVHKSSKIACSDKVISRCIVTGTDLLMRTLNMSKYTVQQFRTLLVLSP